MFFCTVIITIIIISIIFTTENKIKRKFFLQETPFLGLTLGLLSKFTFTRLKVAKGFSAIFKILIYPKHWLIVRIYFYSFFLV